MRSELMSEPELASSVPTLRYERRADIHEAFLAIGWPSSALAFCSNNGFVRRS